MKAASLQAASFYSKLNHDQKDQWLRLLHIHDGETLIDQEGFFIASDGEENPEAELDAFIDALKEKNQKFGRFEVNAACAYPARTLFAKRAGLIDFGPDLGDCVPWKKWQNEIAPEAISIIFSTSYPNNPGSMFGHTFMRFHKKGQKNDLLNYGANFSALVNQQDWGPVYAFKGVFGGYPGFFDLSPYYIKVNEYNNGENRDLIEYELNLTQEQVDMIFAHLWELYNGAYFDYYFTWENCSFHLAELIGVAQALPEPYRWYYLPADLIMAIDEEKLIRHRVERLSMQKKTLAQVYALSEKQWDRVKEVKESGDLSLLAGVQEYDALIAWLNYENIEYKGNISTFQAKLMGKVLSARSKIKERPVDIEMPALLNRPELAHKPRRLSLGAGLVNEEGYYQVGLRQGFHDLMANDLGLDPFAQFQFLSFDLIYLQDQKEFSIPRATLVEITSLSPWTKISQGLSWKVGGRLEQIGEVEGLYNSRRFRGFGKVGLSFGDRDSVIALFGGATGDLSHHYKHSYQLNLNWEAIAAQAFSFGKILVGYDNNINVEKAEEKFYKEIYLSLNFFFSQNQELRVNGSQFFYGKDFHRRKEEYTLEWGLYF